MAWFRKEKRPAPMSENPLRGMVFNVSAEELGLTASSHPSPIWGLVMELGLAKGVATLVALADGTTSLYFSSGGGILGAGEHSRVREASTAWLALAAEHLSLFQLTTDTAPPRAGRVVLYAKSFQGLLRLEASEMELGEHRHPAAPLFHAGQAVITTIRELREQN